MRKFSTYESRWYHHHQPPSNTFSYALPQTTRAMPDPRQLRDRAGPTHSTLAFGSTSGRPIPTNNDENEDEFSAVLLFCPCRPPQTRTRTRTMHPTTPRENAEMYQFGEDESDEPDEPAGRKHHHRNLDKRTPSCDTFTFSISRPSFSSS